VLFRYLALSVLLLVASTQAYALSIELFEYVDGRKIVAFVDENDIGDSIQWHPFKESPPITIRKVTKSIQKYIASDKKLKNAELAEIELRPIPRHEEHWHYVVKLKTEANDEVHYQYYVVLMSGKIIPAIREPESIK
jgi:hypothetical protein